MDICFAFVSVILVLWLIWRKRHLSTFKRLDIPGPEPNLLFGNILELYRKGPIQCHEEWVEKYGRVLGYFYGMKPVLLVADPQMLKDVFIKDFPKFCNRERASPIADYNPHDKYAQGIESLPGKQWKSVRSVLTPSFTASKLKQMTGIMNSSIETMVGIITEKAEGGSAFDAKETFERLSMDIMVKTLFGLHTKVQKDDESYLYKAGRLLMSTRYRNPLVFIGLCFPSLKWYCYKAQFTLLRLYNGGQVPMTTLHKNIKAVIGHRRKNPQNGKVDILQLMIDSQSPADAEEVDVNLLEIGITEYEDAISKIKPKTKTFTGMSDNEILSCGASLLAAGYETSTSTLSFATALIAKHQDVQQKMYEEIRKLIPNDQTIDYNVINKMHYMDKVINETLRMYPPTTLFTSRFAMEDVQYGDLEIPKGMLIQAPTYLMHHDPEFWGEPETFDPERFNDKMNTNGIVYMPFGIGPRNCIGMRLAKLAVKLALAHIVHKFKITLADSQDKFDFEFQLRTIFLKNGCRVKMELRHPEDE